MNRTFITTIGLLIGLAASVPAAIATEVAAKPETVTLRATYNPHTLVGAAYNGRLGGIASYGDLEAEVLARDIKAEDLIEAGIAQGRLSAAHLEDRGFVNAVNANLRSLISGE